jgi:hypothetical protein
MGERIYPLHADKLHSSQQFGHYMGRWGELWHPNQLRPYGEFSYLWWRC